MGTLKALSQFSLLFLSLYPLQLVCSCRITAVSVSNSAKTIHYTTSCTIKPVQYVFSQFIPNDSCFFDFRPLQYVFMIQDKPQAFGLLLSNPCKKFLLSSPNHGFGCSIVTKSVQGVLIHVFRSKRSGKLIFHTISGSLIHTCIRIKHTHKTTTIWRIMWRKN